LKFVEFSGENSHTWEGDAMRAWIAILGLLGAPGLASGVDIDWVTVGAPGNPVDYQNPFGAVAEVYQISEFEITNGQYAELLNAVAATDSNGLYNAEMASSPSGGVTQSGSTGSFGYDVKPGFADKPVNFVSFWDALRFANWLHNGKPTGTQGNATTEDGSYTITEQAVENNSITRNSGGTVFLTSEDEWYKAAYYDSALDFYFTYPTAATVATSCAPPGDTAHTANCDDEVGGPTDVGAYTSSPGPWGTFDQGGNLYEWTEGLAGDDSRIVRGGSFDWGAITLSASIADTPAAEFEGVNIGFRVSSVPEPGLATGWLTAAGTLGYLARRRKRSRAR
jgi:formylglycine-generating enzyme required for sulfatase activity